MHSFHLTRVPPWVGVAALARRPRSPGLRHAELLTQMTLGAPVVSPQRLRLTRLAMFAAWDDESALDSFLADHPLGRRFALGWHVRLEYLRRWGEVADFADLPRSAGRTAADEPVVAVTLARMRLRELPRFLHWGRPVERQVRDHPGTTLAMAAMRPIHTVSTFSIWRSAREMTDMVHGRTTEPGAERHVAAMGERDRRDFHHEFTTLRFRPLAERGTWDQRSELIPWRNRDEPEA